MENYRISTATATPNLLATLDALLTLVAPTVTPTATATQAPGGSIPQP